MKLKDRFWIWGQDAMSHQLSLGNKTWKLPDGNRMDSVAGAEYLGIPNICRVVMCGKPEPPFDAESEKMKHIPRVVWSAMGDSGSARNDKSSDLEEVLRQAQMYPNIIGAVLDDFFKHDPEAPEIWGRYTVEAIREMKHRLHSQPRPLDLWVVWYKRQLEYEIDDYLKEFDVITYWNMKTPMERGSVHQEDLARMIERTPGRRRLTGCYIWNYGAGKPLTVDEIQYECQTYYDLIKKGFSEGIVFCGNCCADLGLEAVEWLRGWIREAGEEEI